MHLCLAYSWIQRCWVLKQAKLMSSRLDILPNLGMLGYYPVFDPFNHKFLSEHIIYMIRNPKTKLLNILETKMKQNKKIISSSDLFFIWLEIQITSTEYLLSKWTVDITIDVFCHWNVADCKLSPLFISSNHLSSLLVCKN
jgi:hypothetical protein